MALLDAEVPRDAVAEEFVGAAHDFFVQRDHPLKIAGLRGATVD
jgi:hypothetical protein